MILEDQSSVLAKFYVFSSTHVAAHYSGIITDDFASEFDPFAPAFGEKFSVPNLPISYKDFNGVEISRTYSDQWGFFNGLTYSTWEVNPPNPTGYAPQTMVTCMNDPGPVPGPNGALITDPLYNPSYSQFCYEWTFMPGQTAYMDTPVIPTASFAEGYDPVDCAYPDATPAVASVLGDTAGGGAGPWVSAAGHTLTINALAPSGTAGMQVPNNAYSGPQATTAPFNQKFQTRHYGFGSRCTVAGRRKRRLQHCVPRDHRRSASDDHLLERQPDQGHGAEPDLLAVDLHDRATHHSNQPRNFRALRRTGHHSW